MINGPRHEKKRIFAYAKTKAQISCAQLISALVFRYSDSKIPFLLKHKISSVKRFVGLYRLLYVGPGRKPQMPVFSRRGSNYGQVYLSQMGKTRKMSFT